MSKTVFAKDEHNQYNTGTIVKEVADFYGQAIRTTDADSVIGGYFTHFRATYDVNNNPTLVNYYRGMTAYKTAITFSSAATLNNKYFVIHSAPDEQVYVIYFDVDGTGTAPGFPGTKIRIQVSASDSAEIVAAMVKLTLDSLYSDKFTAGTRNGASLEISTAGLGETLNSFDVNTGFTFGLTQGTQTLVTKLTILYTGTDPVYQGQTLKGYSFDIYSGKFITGATTAANQALTNGLLTNLANYITHNTEDVALTTYVGTATHDGKYIIKRIVDSSGALTLSYANISNNVAVLGYEAAWTDRLILNYDYIFNLTGIY